MGLAGAALVPLHDGEIVFPCRLVEPADGHLRRRRAAVDEQQDRVAAVAAAHGDPLRDPADLDAARLLDAGGLLNAAHVAHDLLDGRAPVGVLGGGRWRGRRVPGVGQRGRASHDQGRDGDGQAQRAAGQRHVEHSSGMRGSTLLRCLPAGKGAATICAIAATNRRARRRTGFSAASAVRTPGRWWSRARTACRPGRTAALRRWPAACRSGSPCLRRARVRPWATARARS